MSRNVSRTQVAGGPEHKDEDSWMSSHVGWNSTHESPGPRPGGTSTVMFWPLTFTAIARPPSTPGGTVTSIMLCPCIVPKAAQSVKV